MFPPIVTVDKAALWCVAKPGFSTLVKNNPPNRKQWRDHKLHCTFIIFSV